MSSDFFLELLLLKSRGQILLCYLMPAGFEANATIALFIHRPLFSNRVLWGINVLLELILFPVWGKTNKQVYSFRELGNCRLPITFLEEIFYKEC